VGQERLGPSYFFISLVLGPLNNLLWYVPSSRYIWKVYMELGSSFLFLQEQIKDIIIIETVLSVSVCRWPTGCRPRWPTHPGPCDRPPQTQMTLRSACHQLWLQPVLRAWPSSGHLLHIYIYSCLCLCMCVCAYVCWGRGVGGVDMYTYTYIHTYFMKMYTYIYIYIYIYIYKYITLSTVTDRNRKKKNPLYPGTPRFFGFIGARAPQGHCLWGKQSKFFIEQNYIFLDFFSSTRHFDRRPVSNSRSLMSCSRASLACSSASSRKRRSSCSRCW
jgi:hypothetical protein